MIFGTLKNQTMIPLDPTSSNYEPLNPETFSNDPYDPKPSNHDPGSY